jgi:hypothetical protein
MTLLSTDVATPPAPSSPPTIRSLGVVGGHIEARAIYIVRWPSAP